MAHQNVRPRVLQFAHFTRLLALCLVGSSPLAAKGGAPEPFTGVSIKVLSARIPGRSLR